MIRAGTVGPEGRERFVPLNRRLGYGMDGSETVSLQPAIRATTQSGEDIGTRIDGALDDAYRLAAVILGNPADAEDAVADTALAAWRARRRLRDISRFDAWFGRILVNTCRDRLRRRRTRAVVEIDVAIVDDRPDFRDAMVRRDLVARAMARLPVDEQIALALRFWADLSIESIAARTGAPT